jgi:hypothetical protein
MLAFFMTAAARSEALPRQIVPLSPARTLSRG